MRKQIMMDALNLTVYAPADLTTAAYSAINRALKSSRFQAALLRAIRQVVSRHRALETVRVKLSR